MRRSSRSGFTLLEMLVVLSIAALLTGLLLAAVQRARAAAARAKCANRMRQLGLALHQYHGAHQRFPPGSSHDGGRSPQRYMGWHTRILPFVEQEALWRAAEAAYRVEPSPFRNPPHVGLNTVVPLFTCPLDHRLHEAQVSLSGKPVAHTSYLGNAGLDHASEDGLLFRDSRTNFAAILDGSSNTLLLGERPPAADLYLGWWYAGWGQDGSGSGDMFLGVRERRNPAIYPECPVGPYAFGPGRLDDQCALFQFWSLHAGGGHFTFADGSVRFLAYSATVVLPLLATRAGGEAAAPP